MNIFIDTNVLLNFFHLSGEDIEELKKVVELIAHQKLTLFVPRQVCDEFHRNREVKISEGAKQVPNSIKLKLPAYYRSHDKFKDLNKKISDIDKEYANFLALVAEEIENCTLSADTLISDMFAKAKMIEVPDDLIYAAVRRLRRGNPPGKKDRSVVGDEINWEALIKEVPHGEDLHIVSVDSDFSSVSDNTKIKKYLSDEWTEKKASSVRLYRGLSVFFAAHYPDIKLAADVAKTASIDSLASSGSFYSTHLAIGALSKYVGSFTAAEGKKLADILPQNPQVRRIIGDPDVKEFYTAISQIHGLDHESLGIINAELDDEDPGHDDDFPF